MQYFNIIILSFKQPDNQICKKIKFDSSFNQHEAEAKTECSQTSTQDCTADDNILCSSPSSPTDMGMKELQLVLERKQETLRKLNMVKMYRKKVLVITLTAVFNFL